MENPWRRAISGAARAVQPAQERLRPLKDDVRTFILDQPTLAIDLMFERTRDNDPFYARLVKEFHDNARAGRRKMPLVPRFEWGVALCRLPSKYEQYFMMVDGAARRNLKKADRSGYLFSRIDPNDHLEGMAEVLRSTTVRQGPMPAEILESAPSVRHDPPSKTNVHDYPFFGVLKDGKLTAFASCFVAGQMCAIETIYGHAGHQEAGVVPRLVLGMAEYAYGHYPHVRYFVYDTYFGASESLRRFKRKFRFLPHRVRWALDGGGDSAPRDGAKQPLALDVQPGVDVQLVYRQVCDAPLQPEARTEATFHYLDNAAAAVLLQRALRTRFRPAALPGTAAKLASGRRHYYCVTLGGRVVSDGWVSLGFCRHYHVEPESAVIGPVWTDPDQRGKGLATFALANAVTALYERGRSVTYIDTTRDNLGMQKAIERVGYGKPVAAYPRPAEP
jgi:hypothetical protein